MVKAGTSSTCNIVRDIERIEQLFKLALSGYKNKIVWTNKLHPQCGLHPVSCKTSCGKLLCSVTVVYFIGFYQ